MTNINEPGASQSEPPKSSVIMAFLKRMANRKKGIALGAILVGNIATLIGSLNAINKAIFELLGFKPLELIYANMRIVVLVLFGVGYAFLFYWLYKKYLSRLPGTRKLVYSIPLGCVILGTFALNVASLPKKPKPEPLAEKLITKWANRIYSGQDQKGGIYVNIMDAGQGTQVWTTAQCLKAILSARVDLENHTQFIKSAFNFIEEARRNDPEAGWGLQLEHKKTITEIAGWVAIAYIASLDPDVHVWSDSETPEVLNRIQRDLDYLVSRQEGNGAWRPIKEESLTGYPSFTRTYSSVLALWSLVEARRSPAVHAVIGNKYDQSIRNGIMRLFATYDKNLGWLPNPNRGPQSERYEGLTAMILFVLSRAEQEFGFLKGYNVYIEAEQDFLNFAQSCKQGQCRNNRIHDADVSFRPIDFVAEGSTMLWFPWTFAELTHLSTDAGLSEKENKSATNLRQEILKGNLDAMDKFVESEYTYVLAENLFCLSISINKAPTAD